MFVDCVSIAVFVLTANSSLGTNYSSIPAGTVCIRRPTDCKALAKDVYVISNVFLKGTANYTSVVGETCGTLQTAVPNVSATQLYKWNP